MNWPWRCPLVPLIGTTVPKPLVNWPSAFVCGAAVKVVVSFNPDKQSWTRQSTGIGGMAHHVSSAVLMWLSLLLLAMTAMVVSTL